MKVHFQKYQGAGNDFIIIDNRAALLPKSDEETIKWLCDRHFGIGADGLIFIQDSKKADFEMVYFNADGKIGSMCGNGARCAVLFAKSLGLVKEKETSFIAYDGLHKALIINDKKVKVLMSDVKDVKHKDGHYVMNTGSPHYVTFTNKLVELKVKKEGQKVRYSKPYAAEGINVNFVALTKKHGTHMRTYERGVEDETLACGTGTVAVAVAVALKQKAKDGQQEYPIHAVGGELKVYLEKSKKEFKNIWLEGPAKKTFEGDVDITALKANPHVM